MKIEIKNDVFNIVNRLKKIDKNYFVLFNLDKNTFEIHNKAQLFSTYCLTLPYSTLDKRAIDYVLKTSIKNMEMIASNIDIQNNNLKLNQENELEYVSKYKLKTKLKYLSNR